MLSKLTIDNYALIDKTVIDFHDGFTVITGETGAGKSIMLGALSLLMGARADSKSMGNKDRKTVVEALFVNLDSKLKGILEENGIDWDDEELILRREISVAGKSRAFINDTPVNLSVLSKVAESLLDIHSQHGNSLLNKPQEQLAIIDSYGQTGHLLEDYKETFKSYVSLRNRIKKIKESIEKGKENKEYLLFRLEQLDKLKPRRGELAALEREFEILGDADRIKSGLSEANSIIDSGSNSIIRLLQSVYSIVSDIDLSLFDPKEEDNISERLDSLKIELRDISDTLESYAEKINSDPERLSKVQDRIEKIEEGMKHFKVKDEEELVTLQEQLREELDAISEGNTDLGSLEAKLKDLAKELKEKAESLSRARNEAAKNFESSIEEKIAPLGMPNVKFHVDVQKGKMTSDGQDIINFYSSFNKNHEQQLISEIASGGEISRLMLGIKSVMAKTMKLPTIIFDEIDTGVSGEIAHKMGRMMKEMTPSIQVMAVTHLPQVAANGDHHLKVYKKDEEEKTISHVMELDSEARVKEIAGMLSGNTINEIALENARQLLKQN